MGRFVIAACRPKPGRAAALDAVVAGHRSVLRGEGLGISQPASLAEVSAPFAEFDAA